MEIDFDPEETWSDEEVAGLTSAYNFDAPIYIVAVEGLNGDINDFIGDDDDYYKSPRRAIAKAKTMSKLSPFYRK